jgi:hypothetical protein
MPIKNIYLLLIAIQIAFHVDGKGEEMSRWPRSYNNAEEVYNNNEAYGTGRYPISENYHWHSGIHINFLSGTELPEVYPFINGQLVASRISKDYQEVPRPKQITESEFKRLPGREQRLYRQTGTRTKKYEIKPDIPEEEQKEQYSNNFILLRHSFRIKEEDEEIYFYTLYTNIVPFVGGLEPNYDKISRMQKKMPFYLNYKFKVNKEITASKKYTVKEEVKLFPGSQCLFWEKDDANYYCNFDNFDNKNKIIEVDKKEIAGFEKNVYYIPKEAGVIIYVDIPERVLKDPDNNKEELKKYEKATLNMDAKFTIIVKEEEKFYCVLVYKNEVNEKNVITADKTAVLVQKKDLIKKQRGYLIENNTICTEEIKGIMIYDSIKDGNKERNARDIIEAEKEFRMVEPQKVLNYKKYQGQYLLIESTDNKQRYILCNDINDDIVQVKEELKNDLCDFEEGVPTQDKKRIYEDTLLGYADLSPSYNNAYYDVALFFGDKSFLRNQTELNNHYFFGPVVLYKLTYKSYNNTVLTEKQIYGNQIIMATGDMLNAEGKQYVEFLYNGDKYYIPIEKTLGKKIDKFEWEKIFRVLTKEVKTVGDFINGIEFMIGEINWTIERNESMETKLKKRSIICGHPLELDKELYIENGEVKQEIRKGYGIGRSREEWDYFINRVNAVDIWGGLKEKKINGLDTSKNSFWFAHPVYFLNNLRNAGLMELSREEEILAIQDFVIKQEWLKIGEEGIYSKDKNPGYTFCNHAVYLTIKALDANYKNFINMRGVYEHDDPPYSRSKEYEYRESNYWCDLLEQLSGKSETGIIRLKSEDEALNYANKGYVVIGALKSNVKIKEVSADKQKQSGKHSPHFATIRPGIAKDPDKGVMLANVGVENGIVRAVDAFGSLRYPNIKWYYNSKQFPVYRPEEVKKK